LAVVGTGLKNPGTLFFAHRVQKNMGMNFSAAPSRGLVVGPQSLVEKRWPADRGYGTSQIGPRRGMGRFAGDSGSLMPPGALWSLAPGGRGQAYLCRSAYRFWKNTADRETFAEFVRAPGTDRGTGRTNPEHGWRTVERRGRPRRTIRCGEGEKGRPWLP